MDHVVFLEIRKFYKVYTPDDADDEMTEDEIREAAIRMAIEDPECLTPDDEIKTEEQDILGVDHAYDI